LNTGVTHLVVLPFTNGVLLVLWDTLVGVPLLDRDEVPFGTVTMCVFGAEDFSNAGDIGVALLELIPFVTDAGEARDGPSTALAGEFAVGHPAGNTLGEKCCTRFAPALLF
jgi:hypothetical protein